MNTNIKTQNKVSALPPLYQAGAKFDGEQFINVDTRATTELGRLLALNSHVPFVHPYLGPFNSLIGFWYWLSTGSKHDGLRYCSGMKARQVGRGYPTVNHPYFYEEVLGALFQKIDQNKQLRDMFARSVLPFENYYEFGDNKVVIADRYRDWLVPGLHEIREAMIRDEEPNCWKVVAARYNRMITDGEDDESGDRTPEEEAEIERTQPRPD